MAATMSQFMQEVGPLLKDLYIKHQGSRADYKSAAEALSVKKMPRTTEADRRKFVGFALTCFDLMARAGVDPNQSVAQLGQNLSQRVVSN